MKGQQLVRLEAQHLRDKTTGYKSAAILFAVLFGSLTLTGLVFKASELHVPGATLNDSFFFNVTPAGRICSGMNNQGASYAGHIGLQGDSDSSPKRSFFWFFEAEKNSVDAPVLLTIAGGPGSSGLMNAFYGQSPCILTAEGLVNHPNSWTERYNLIVLDHPVGVGYSYGLIVNNSRSAAEDVYDFLQKFFKLYPHLAKNRLVLCGGSYGGVYIPNIATVINEGNRALAEGTGKPGAIRLHLDSMMIHNPLSDPVSYITSFLDFVCVEHRIFDTVTCQQKYPLLPDCIQRLQLAFALPTLTNRLDAFNACFSIPDGDWHDTVPEDIRRKCHNDQKDPVGCHPFFSWLTSTFDNVTMKDRLGVPAHVKYYGLNREVTRAFQQTGDVVRQHYMLYEPLLKDGIRLLHYIGLQDANCNWHGILAMLKLIHSPYQEDFIQAPDVPWPKQNPQATVRVVGEGAGSMTLVLLDGAGHFVVRDQPKLAKEIAEHWIDNEPFF